MTRAERRNVIITRFVLCFIPVLAACSLEPAGLRNIRAHTSDHHGVAHGEPVRKAARYCQHCHGLQLAGGDQGEPSCFQCHGMRWLDLPPELSFAPADHTIAHGGFRHHPGYAAPLATCTQCHGEDLQGQVDEGTPSCYLCHDQKWVNEF